MIAITLTPEQAREARSGVVTLTEEQVSSANAKRVIARRVFAVTCECGECTRCRNREKMRARRAAASE